jgi:ABC-type nitrate/sulfonate/bicarbonate transport system permease component
MTAGMRNRLPALLLLAVLLLAWEAYVRIAGVDPVVLPSPSRILGALWQFRGDAVRHTIPTVLETAIGFTAAVLLAVGAAVGMDRLPIVRRTVEPLLVASQTIPVIALAPLLLLWFGFGLLPKIVIVVLVTFFPVCVALLEGFGSASPEAADLLRSYGASDGQAFRKLRWPSALPALFIGLRISVVYAVIGAVFGEYVGAKDGLGIWMQLAAKSFRTDLVFAAVVVTSLVSLILYAVVGLVRRATIPWAPGVRHEIDVEERPF